MSINNLIKSGEAKLGDLVRVTIEDGKDKGTILHAIVGETGDTEGEISRGLAESAGVAVAGKDARIENCPKLKFEIMM